MLNCICTACKKRGLKKICRWHNLNEMDQYNIHYRKRNKQLNLFPGSHNTYLPAICRWHNLNEILHEMDQYNIHYRKRNK
jgi:hypothetical protein